MKKCLVIGSTVCDIIIYVDRLPTSQGDVHIKEQMMSLGGCAYNVVSVLHHLKIPYTFISPVGRGIYGEFVQHHLAAKGIETTVRLSGNNGCCYCFVEENGDRTFMSDHGFEYSFSAAWLDNLNLDDYAYVYICGLEVEEKDGQELIAALQDYEGQIMFAPGPRGHLIDQHRLAAVYALSPIVHLNAEEVMTLTDEDDVQKAVLKMNARTGRPVIVTQGASGVLVYDGDFTQLAGYPQQVVDTIGAGDSHVGAVMAGQAAGRPLVAAAEFGNKVSSEIVGVSGVELPDEVYLKLREVLNS